jgi:POT family proton-dependent oligopeptide transporter
MVAGPIGGFVGALTAPPAGQHFTKLQSIAVYGHVFLVIGIVVVVIAIIMWAIRGWLNKVINSTLDYVQTLHNPNEESANLIK